MSKQEISNIDEYIRYKFLIENIKDVIWELDINLVFTFVSPTIKDMTGYRVDEIVGRCISDFLTEESKARLQKQWNNTLHKRIDSSSINAILFDAQMFCKNGEIIWCEVCIKPNFRDKEFRGYIGTTRDVSEKKNHENELKKYLEELEEKNKQLEDKNKKLEDLATLDMLTGTYNRRKFEHFVGLEIEKKEKYDSAFSIIMFDIDNFKGINDHYGHEVGDRVLQNITALIEHTLRLTDKLFRWGGDEFIILLPELDLKNALTVAEKVRSTIQSYDFDIENNEVTVSLGVGNYILNENMDQFITRVDNALLKAKHNGRNRVKFA